MLLYSAILSRGWKQSPGNTRKLNQGTVMTNFSSLILLTIAILMLTSCTVKAHPASDSYGTTIEEVRANVSGYLEGRGYRLGRGADYDFRRAYQTLAETLDNVDGADRTRLLRDFEHNAIRMVDAMIDASYEIEGYRKLHPGVIGETDLCQS